VQYYEGVGGMFNDNNLYALGAAMIIPLLVAVAQNAPRKWLKLGFFIAAPLSAFTVISLFSRGGILALGAALLVFAVLQRRRFTYLTAIAVLAGLTLMYAPIPEGWFDRVETIQTATNAEDEGGDRSALGRLHFWHTATQMAMDRPLGVGLKNFEVAYDQYDDSRGAYGRFRAVHSSHFQVLAENGFLGAAIWVGLFAWSFVLIFRIRRRTRDPQLSPQNARFVMTMANGLAASMAGFLVGGSFASMALNDITWLTFALLASLDRISLQMCAAAVEKQADTAAGAARQQPVPAGAAARVATARALSVPLERRH
jgi:probable O-glycosylation ligase (exosortase A-associated)